MSSHSLASPETSGRDDPITPNILRPEELGHYKALAAYLFAECNNRNELPPRFLPKQLRVAFLSFSAAIRRQSLRMIAIYPARLVLPRFGPLAHLGSVHAETRGREGRSQ